FTIEEGALYHFGKPSPAWDQRRRAVVSCVRRRSMDPSAMPSARARPWWAYVEVQSNIRAVDPAALQGVLRMHRGDIYNGDAVEKTVEDVTVEITKHGYPFATVRPRGDRDPQNHLINVAFVVDEGVRAYIERINIRGKYAHARLRDPAR